MVFKENFYASLIDCAQRVSARAEGAGRSNVDCWITSELGWNVRRPKVQAPRSRSRDASLLGPCRLKDGALPLEVQARTVSRTLFVSHSRLDSPIHVKTWGDRGGGVPHLPLSLFSVESSHQVLASLSRPTRCNTSQYVRSRVVFANSRTEISLVGY
ncbi:hypothetical protein B0H13DRAFT_2056068 [Mycena leptocephala]|nr:hypothetical protein B0H13DRAFT_2056068 [Mycena leptocephala]